MLTHEQTNSRYARNKTIDNGLIQRTLHVLNMIGISLFQCLQTRRTKTVQLLPPLSAIYAVDNLPILLAILNVVISLLMATVAIWVQLQSTLCQTSHL